jgi:hypothetical protein
MGTEVNPIMFLVLREGVGIEGFVGIFTAEAKARTAAEEAKKLERNDCCEFVLYEVPVDLRMEALNPIDTYSVPVTEREGGTAKWDGGQVKLL